MCALEAKVTAIPAFLIPSDREPCIVFLVWLVITGTSIVHPLTSLLNPKVDFLWNLEYQHSFACIKSLLSCSPILGAPDLSRPFKLEVDGSAVGAAAVLLLEDKGGADHPVSHFKFNRHHVNYSSIEKEMLTLILALQMSLGSSTVLITAYTDHSPLVCLSYAMHICFLCMKRP